MNKIDYKTLYFPHSGTFKTVSFIVVETDEITLYIFKTGDTSNAVGAVSSDAGIKNFTNLTCLQYNSRPILHGGSTCIFFSHNHGKWLCGPLREPYYNTKDEECGWYAENGWPTLGGQSMEWPDLIATGDDIPQQALVARGSEFYRSSDVWVTSWSTYAGVYGGLYIPYPGSEYDRKILLGGAVFKYGNASSYTGPLKHKIPKLEMLGKPGSERGVERCLLSGYDVGMTGKLTIHVTEYMDLELVSYKATIADIEGGTAMAAFKMKERVFRVRIEKVEGVDCEFLPEGAIGSYESKYRDRSDSESHYTQFEMESSYSIRNSPWSGGRYRLYNSSGQVIGLVKGALNHKTAQKIVPTASDQGKYPGQYARVTKISVDASYADRTDSQWDVVYGFVHMVDYYKEDSSPIVYVAGGVRWEPPPENPLLGNTNPGTST